MWVARQDDASTGKTNSWRNVLLATQAAKFLFQFCNANLVSQTSRHFIYDMGLGSQTTVLLLLLTQKQHTRHGVAEMAGFPAGPLEAGLTPAVTLPNTQAASPPGKTTSPSPSNSSAFQAAVNSSRLMLEWAYEIDFNPRM